MKRNCHFCSHHAQRDISGECERFSARHEECLTWIEIRTHQLLSEASELMSTLGKNSRAPANTGDPPPQEGSASEVFHNMDRQLDKLSIPRSGKNRGL